MENVVNTNSPSALELEQERIPTTTPSPSNEISSRSEVGGWRSVKFIIGNESFEKLASMSLISNLTMYLLTNYNLSGLFVVNVVQIWNGSSNIASIVGAFISDTYLGRFRTLLYGSISSLLGIMIMTLTAGIHQLRPITCKDKDRPHCQHPQDWQLGVLFASLGLLSIGAGGIRPCNIAFGADQFDTTTEKGKGQLESFFNWWYFTFTIALVVALTGVVYIQTNISWTLGFAIPTVCLAFSITIFLLGRHTYIYKKPQGSIFTDMAKVIAAAYRKRRLQPSDRSFYEPASTFEDNIRLVQTNRFKFLDKAAIIADPSELNNQGIAKNGWRLCSLQQVEHLKCLIGILPIWVTGICCFIVMDQQNTFGVLQVIQTDRSIGPHFKIPPGWMNLTSMIALSFWIYIYECIYIPLMKRINKRATRMSMVHRIRIGIILSILCMLVAAIIEKKRRDSALRQSSFISPVSFGLLLPQYALSGLNEAFAAVAIMEFFTLQLPESMRTVAGAIFFLSLSIANYLGSLIVMIVHKASNTAKIPCNYLICNKGNETVEEQQGNSIAGFKGESFEQDDEEKVY
uniref:Protein NRT1/ PTR FAMILY 2.8 isoform X2 n=1 Tax=Cicer arietinum TaxID=3827 RepID=A0A3Q7YGK9_CICAR|nr:protein NRT1/ PTR FAMILY 2.8 isoform X2 [Cicer arietinum]